MNVEQIVKRHAQRPGFTLVDFAEVGLPIYRLTLRVILQTHKSLPPIPEFVLKSVDGGLDNSKDLSAFLGLDERLVTLTLTDLIREEQVTLGGQVGSRRQVLSVTQKGTRSLQEASMIIPSEDTIQLDYDGLTRQPMTPLEFLLRPKELREQGLREIRAFPAKPPDIEDLKIRDVASVLQRFGGRGMNRDLIAIKSLDRRERYYREALALIFKSADGDEYRVGFAIDGRLSTEHEQAFAVADGPRKHGIVQQASTQPIQIPMLEPHLLERIPPASTLVESDAAIAQAESLQQAAQMALEAAESPNERREAEQKAEEAEAKVNTEYEKLRQTFPVRFLAVQDHPPLLDRALRESKKRLIIISPWIRAKVVNRHRIGLLEQLLNHGVEVYIGYGISDAPDDKMESHDKRAEDDLKRLASRFTSFHLKRFGNTHEKILIKDDEFSVVTSFNWLSYLGDPKKPFRAEQGVYVGISEKVNDFGAMILGRFSNEP